VDACSEANSTLAVTTEHLRSSWPLNICDHRLLLR
jgi:hypothetical protein